MRIFRHVTDLPAEFRGAVVAIGNFDGVHRGHAQVIGRAAELAVGLGAPLAVLTFEPHPREFFAPEAPPFRLTPLRTKAHLLGELGVEALFALHFDAQMSKIPAEDFVRSVLIEGLGARHLIVGYDFAFGHKRSGSAETLTAMAAAGGYQVSVVEPAGADGEVFSSSRIRDFLWQGRPRQAADLLGHWWEVEGRVAEGDRRGRQIGFPTANFSIDGYLEAAFGVYAVRVGELVADALVWRDGVANFGRRPTFGKVDAVLEAHLFDFTGDLYGRLMRVAFVDFIRPEQKFDGIDALKTQIAADAAEAKRRLALPENAADALGRSPGG